MLLALQLSHTMIGKLNDIRQMLHTQPSPLTGLGKMPSSKQPGVHAHHCVCISSDSPAFHDGMCLVPVHICMRYLAEIQMSAFIYAASVLLHVLFILSDRTP
jgi:hypothetical protein